MRLVRLVAIVSWFIGACTPRAIAPPPEAPPPAPSITTAGAPAPAACTAPEYHRLDFWLGEWDVTTPDGKRDGTNVITRTLDGCAIEEQWEDAAGWRGTSIFSFDRNDHEWKQLWVTSTGVSDAKREIRGENAGAVTFEGISKKHGRDVRSQTTLVALDANHVRQVILESEAGGAPSARWEGLYTRRASRAPTAEKNSSASSAPPTSFAAACASAEHRQFDFWIGDWDLTIRTRKSPTSEEWVESHGENHVRATYQGCVIEESFHANASAEPAWAGHSISSFTSGMWRQTWVDDQGSYLAFTGEKKSGEMILYGEATKDAATGAPKQMRMVFTNIEKNSLSWRWERVMSDGTFRLAMTIQYRRRDPLAATP